jgi:hypothetical protein
MMPPIMASISRKSSNKVPIIIFQMLFAGRRTHNIGAFFFMGPGGFLWVQSWEVKILWVWIMGVTVVGGSDKKVANFGFFVSWQHKTKFFGGSAASIRGFRLIEKNTSQTKKK